MMEREQVPFDPVALDAEIDAAVKASFAKLAKKTKGQSTTKSPDSDTLVAASRDFNK